MPNMLVEARNVLNRLKLQKAAQREQKKRKEPVEELFKAAAPYRGGYEAGSTVSSCP